MQYMLLVFNKISVFSLLTMTKACYVCFLEGVTVRKESNDVNDELTLVFLFFSNCVALSCLSMMLVLKRGSKMKNYLKWSSKHC